MPQPRRRSALLVPLTLFTLVASFFQAIPASAAGPFIVNSSGDTADVNAGDGFCDDGTTACTLRAAIQEANAFAGQDTIQFSIGTGAQTIAPASQLPTITDGVV